MFKKQEEGVIISSVQGRERKACVEGFFPPPIYLIMATV